MAINAQGFSAALDEIEQAKGISRETILAALEEAMVKGFKKQLGGDDALVRVNIDPDKGIIEMFQIKMVVEEVEDDFLEISLEDAKAIDKKLKVGDEYLIPASVDDLRKATAMSIKSILKQKFVEAERGILYDQFKDKINTMITGRIENIDERGCSVNIGRTSVYLTRKEMIGDEKFNAGDNIKLFVSDVATGTKGAHIVVSRANEGFLRCLMTEEIREIYDGTITIKAISREAGERSKVAVFSQDLNVDPAGACIGPNGSRIQKVVGQLGNGSQKEKIDIIAYSDNAALFIMEALKPARVVGVSVDEESKSAIAVVDDKSLSLAIGRKGVNARLAVKLTGYNIDIKTYTDASNEGLSFRSFEEINAEEIEIKAKKLLEAQKAAYLSSTVGKDVLPGLPEGYVAPQARVYEEEANDFDETLREAAEEETVVVKKVAETPVKEEVKAEEVAPISDAKAAEAPVATTKVATTTTLEDLEKSLEASNKKTTTKKSFNKKKKEETVEEDTTPVSKNSDPSTFMSIYTEEELKAMEEEENNDNLEENDEDIDYDDYDEYYEDNK